MILFCDVFVKDGKWSVIWDCIKFLVYNVLFIGLLFRFVKLIIDILVGLIWKLL